MSRWTFSVPRVAPAAPRPEAAPRVPTGWRARLAKDPLPILLREGPPSLSARVRRDLIDDDEAPGPAEVAAYKEVVAFCRKQAKDGSFEPRAADKALGSKAFARALATLRALDRMADFGLRAQHPSVARATDALFASQDKRGAIADLALAETPRGRCKEAAVHFHGWALAALCRLGFEGDPRVERGFRHLLALRQDDGGWAWRGVRTHSAARPSSHLVTGMALRAFAASPSRRSSGEAKRAAELLATRFLQPDRYPDRKAAAFWEAFSEPRFWTDVLDALDGATAVGLGKENSGVRTAEAYLRARQSPDGLWYPGPPARPDTKDREAARWLTLRALVVLRRIN